MRPSVFLSLKRLAVLLVLVATGLAAQAQVSAAVLAAPAAAADTVTAAPRAPWVLGVYAQGSIVLQHTYAIKHLVTSHPTGFELNVQRQTTGAAPWHQWYRYPKVGLALTYYDFHNPIVGSIFAVSPYVSKTFSRGPKHDLNFRLGVGLAYLTNPYDRVANHRNTIASSALNATLQLRVEYDYALTPYLGLLLGLALNHYSNGATSKPNFGVNLPSVVLGFNYHQQRPAPHFASGNLLPAEVGTNFLNVGTSLGFKQRTAGDPKKYLVNSLTLAVGRRVNRKSNLLLGAEGFYDRSLLGQLDDTLRAGAPRPDVKKIGLFAGHELLFGRLAVVSHLGFYVYAPYKSSTVYYERLGLKYQFTEYLFGAIDLKIHRGAADVIEFKIGARLPAHASGHSR